MYNIVRFFQNKESKIIKRGLTLEEAQKHCNDPKTSGKDWFDGYQEIGHPTPQKGLSRLFQVLSFENEKLEV